MKNKKIYFLSFFFFIFNAGHAQNLVPNGSFEGYSICPVTLNGSLTPLSQIEHLYNWVQATIENPDYFNTCASAITVNSVNVPNNVMGSEYAHSGNGYLGIVADHGGTGQEYIEVPLTINLLNGRKYYFEMYVSLAEASCYTSSIGAYFSNSQISDTITTYLNYSPQITSNLITNKSGWTKVSGFYQASGGEKYLTIGNYGGMTMTWAGLPCWNPLEFSYLYIDDVYLVDTCLATQKYDTALCSSSVPLTLNTLHLLTAANYLWNTAATTPSIQITQPGTYWVKYSNLTCLYTDTIKVFDSSLTVSLGPDTFLCNTTSIPITLSSRHYPHDHFIWQNLSSGSLQTLSTDTFLNVIIPGEYMVKVSNTYCSKRDTINVAYVIASDVISDIHTCNNAIFPLKLSATTAKANNYLWSNNSTDSFIIVNDTGLFWVRMNKNSCIVGDTIRVTNTNLAKPDLGSDTTLCAIPSLTLHANVVADSYSWFYNNTYLGTSLLPSLNINNNGFYIVEANKANCKTRDTILVSFKPKPQINLGNDTLLCYNTTLLLQANSNSNVNGLTYKWQDGDTLPYYKVTSAGIYWI